MDMIFNTVIRALPTEQIKPKIGQLQKFLRTEIKCEKDHLDTYKCIKNLSELSLSLRLFTDYFPHSPPDTMAIFFVFSETTYKHFLFSV